MQQLNGRLNVHTLAFSLGVASGVALTITPDPTDGWSALILASLAFAAACVLAWWKGLNARGVLGKRAPMVRGVIVGWFAVVVFFVVWFLVSAL